MANTLFALDIHDDLITWVTVEHTAKTYVITACGMTQTGYRSLETALAEVIAQVGSTRGDFRAALGAEHFFFRNLQFPFSDKVKIGKVLPGELAENSPLAAEDMAFDFLLTKKAGAEANVLAATVAKAFLDERLGSLRALSLDPEFLGISGIHGALEACQLTGEAERFLYLDVGFRRAVLLLIVADQITLVRSLVFDPGLQAGFWITEGTGEVLAIRPTNVAKTYSSFARAVRQTILASRTGLEGRDLPLYLAGPLSASSGLADTLRSELGVEVHVPDLLSLPFVEIREEVAAKWHAGAMDRALALALGNTKSGRVFNFRQGRLKKRGSIRDYRRYGKIVALPLALLTLLVLVALWRDHATLKQQQIDLDKQIREIFNQTLPEVTRIVNPVQQLQVRIKEAKQAYKSAGSEEPADFGILSLLAEISERIPVSMQVRIVRMVADQNDVRLKGTTGNFNIVDTMQKELGKSPYFSKVEISSANLSAKGREVDFELKLDFRR